MPERARYQDLERSRTLWLECLAIGHLARNRSHPYLYAPQIAETAYAAAWASLHFWDTQGSLKSQIEHELERTANFLGTLKPSGQPMGKLMERLRRIPGLGESRTEIWAFLIGKWLLPGGSNHEELLELVGLQRLSVGVTGAGDHLRTEKKARSSPWSNRSRERTPSTFSDLFSFRAKILAPPREKVSISPR